MKKKITIWFDMDGTIADLYNHPDWLKRLRDEDETVFGELKKILDIKDLLNGIVYDDDKIDLYCGIITWSSMESTYDFHLRTADEKYLWLVREQGISLDNRHYFCIPYGTPKQMAIKSIGGYHILVDDNPEVCKTWDTKKKRKSVLITEGVDEERSIASEIGTIIDNF